jgi:hypothetical protein
MDAFQTFAVWPDLLIKKLPSTVQNYAQLVSSDKDTSDSFRCLFEQEQEMPIKKIAPRNFEERYGIISTISGQHLSTTLLIKANFG